MGVAVADAGAEIGHHREGGDRHPVEARQDGFGHRRHADQIRPEAAGHTDFRRRLEARAGEPSVDALVQGDPDLSGGRV